MDDRTIECADCKQDFVFTAGEQTYFEDKGFKPPRRCQKCRRVKRPHFLDAAPATSSEDEGVAGAGGHDDDGGTTGHGRHDADDY